MNQTLRMKIYRSFLKSAGQHWLLPLLISKERLKEGSVILERGREQGLKSGPSEASESGKTQKCFWFHAASVGELESLWPVALEIAGAENSSSVRFVMTVFSSSARSRVQKLADEVRSRGMEVSFCGYSPWEGSWREALRSFRPDCFVTAKYEAWPELWMSLGSERVPLVVVGAKARRSLRFCRDLCRWLGASLPEKLIFVTASDEDERQLLQTFSGSRVKCLGEPRWDQVLSRFRAGNARAREIAERLRDLPRPWGVLGSVWSEDMTVWRGNLRMAQGSLFVVPHKIDSAHLEPLVRALSDEGFTCLRTSEMRNSRGSRGPMQGTVPQSGIPLILVDEMGFLSELYSVADWAYVGGGFGDGVHSTIEPAIQGIPVSCGPARAEKFEEIHQLRESGQLKMVRTAEDVAVWLKSVTQVSLQERESWKLQVNSRLGASKRIASLLREGF